MFEKKELQDNQLNRIEDELRAIKREWTAALISFNCEKRKYLLKNLLVALIKHETKADMHEIKQKIAPIREKLDQIQQARQERKTRIAHIALEKSQIDQGLQNLKAELQ